ncbi:acyl-CoA thioesterase [Actinomycetospora chiangmaiensis]|uniref:acyl-CoA thioesterase n=1 Tax=Actinomycetospora chiangmaiensis TaxID=402650 RepID=UPI0003611584|nr:thioesterase family protein [Actinomycetospora chiangmaiensis]
MTATATAAHADVVEMGHRTHLTVRGYEIDALGHVAGTVYMQYAEHARWECLAAAGLTVNDLLGAGIMPVILEITINYRTELRFGDDVVIGCVFAWGERKTATITQRIERGDGALAAEVTLLTGLLDLQTRKLVATPRERLRGIATAPELLGV